MPQPGVPSGPGSHREGGREEGLAGQGWEEEVVVGSQRPDRGELETLIPA